MGAHTGHTPMLSCGHLSFCTLCVQGLAWACGQEACAPRAHVRKALSLKRMEVHGHEPQARRAVHKGARMGLLCAQGTGFAASHARSHWRLDTDVFSQALSLLRG